MKINNYYKAFGLMEVLTAVFILSIGLTAGLLFTSHYMQMMTYNKNKIIATYLASRELELLRWQRDTNFFQDKIWNESFDALEHTLQQIYLDGDNNYTYTTTSKPTIFEGEMSLQDGAGNDSVIATATIKWDKGQVSLTTTLYNWK